MKPLIPTKVTNPTLLYTLKNKYLTAICQPRFKLSADVEAIYLSDSSGDLIDEVTFPLQTNDQTYGRFPNGTGAFTFMNSTFNAKNSNDSTVSVIGAFHEFENLNIYPNPVHDVFALNFNSNKELQLVVYNSIGANIYREYVTNGSLIDASDWSRGFYLVRIGDSYLGKLFKY